jgi:hypothetical protein
MCGGAGAASPTSPIRKPSPGGSTEETGWLIDTDSLRYLGFLAYRDEQTQPIGHPDPHPDFAQAVFACTATRHATGKPDDWTDTDGWELGASLLSVKDLARTDLDEGQRPYVEHLIAERLLT